MPAGLSFSIIYYSNEIAYCLLFETYATAKRGSEQNQLNANAKRTQMVALDSVMKTYSGGSYVTSGPCSICGLRSAQLPCINRGQMSIAAPNVVVHWGPRIHMPPDDC